MLGHKYGFVFSFSACVTASLLIAWGTSFRDENGNDHTWVIPFGVLGAKFGVSMAFSIFYCATVKYFAP